MTQQNLLELAKQGDAKAIATLMNSQLQPKGLKAKVSIANNCLMVIAESIDPESTQPPSNSFIVNFVRKGVTALNPEEIHRVVIWGKAPGNKAPAWREDFSISEPDPPNDVVEQKNNFQDPQDNIQPEKVTAPKPKKRLKLFSNPQFFLQTEGLVVTGIIFCLLVFVILIYAGKEIFTVKDDSNENVANISDPSDPSVINTEIKNFLAMYFKDSMDQEKKANEFWCDDSKDYVKNFDSNDWQVVDIKPYGNSSVDTTVQINNSNKNQSQTSTRWNIYLKKDSTSQDNKKLPGGWCISSIFSQ